jgi:hypothetical protein
MHAAHRSDPLALCSVHTEHAHCALASLPLPPALLTLNAAAASANNVSAALAGCLPAFAAFPPPPPPPPPLLCPFCRVELEPSP